MANLNYTFAVINTLLDKIFGDKTNIGNQLTITSTGSITEAMLSENKIIKIYSHGTSSTITCKIDTSGFTTNKAYDIDFVLANSDTGYYIELTEFYAKAKDMLRIILPEPGDNNNYGSAVSFRALVSKDLGLVFDLDREFTFMGSDSMVLSADTYDDISLATAKTKDESVGGLLLDTGTGYMTLQTLSMTKLQLTDLKFEVEGYVRVVSSSVSATYTNEAQTLKITGSAAEITHKGGKFDATAEFVDILAGESENVKTIPFHLFIDRIPTNSSANLFKMSMKVDSARTIGVEYNVKVKVLKQSKLS